MASSSADKERNRTLPRKLSKELIGQPSRPLPDADLGEMPSGEELDTQFRRLVDSMDVSADHEAELMSWPAERKWKLIKNDRLRNIALPPDYFCAQLDRHLDPDLKAKRVAKSKLKGLEPSHDVLKKLEVALRTNQASWIEEFLDHPNNGHHSILAFVDDLPKQAHIKPAHKLLQRAAGEHHLCMLCLKAIMRHDYGFRKLINEEGCLNKIALSCFNEQTKTRVLALQMLATAASDPSGGVTYALEAMHHVSCIAVERTRFQTLVEDMEKPDCQDAYTIAALQLIINVVNHAEDLNMLVYLQMDLHRAGLSPIVERLRSAENPTIRKLAKEYRNKLVSVDEIVQSREENYRMYHETVDQVNAMQTTVASVKQQRDELRGMHKDAQMKAAESQDMVTAYRKQTEQLRDKLEHVTSMLSEQQDMVQQTQEQLKEAENRHRRTAEQLAYAASANQGGPMPRAMSGGSAVEAAPPPPPPPPPMDTLDDDDATPSIPPPPPPPPMINAHGTLVIPDAPPLPAMNGLPPPAPPLMGGIYAPPGMKPKRRIQPNVPLPMLNWVPLRKTQDTIFDEIDDENVLAEMDFSEFEAEFRVKDVARKLKGKGKAQKVERITVVESNRARNLVITCRRIGMDYERLRKTIIFTDLCSLAPEHAELLLNFIPTDEETTSIEKYTHRKERLAEAERFMLEMGKVDRYESRLRVMAYVGYFDELVLTVGPQIDAVLQASRTLASSLSFRKLLEIILAFGNYMNSAKRGPAYGFKLPTFERMLDTKSTDRKQTLLHFVVHAVTEHYPQVVSFREEIQQLNEAARVSMVTLQTDVQALRKGIDLLLYEREKQQQNFVIYSFYTNAVHKVARISDRFKLMKDAYREVCVLFNEDPNTLEPFDFFAYFVRFVESFQKCEAENEKRRLAEEAALSAANRRESPEAKEKRLAKFGKKVELPPHPLLNTTTKRAY